MARSRLAAPLQPRRPLLRPAAFSPEFRASPVYAPIPGDAVTDKYRGLSAEQLHQARCSLLGSCTHRPPAPDSPC
jgi:hypothetical protein